MNGHVNNCINKNRNKILIVAYDMIPHGTTWGGSQRMYFLATQLSHLGKDVTVISCKKNKNNSYGKTMNFCNISIPIRNKIVRNFFRESSSNDNKQGIQKKTFKDKLKKFLMNGNLISKLLMKVDKFIFNEPIFLTGITSRVWIKENRKYIYKYIVLNGIQNIIITAPPFGMFRLVNYLRRKSSYLNIIVDYRDPWNLWTKQSRYIQQQEKKVIDLASKITCTNINVANGLSLINKNSKHKIAIISNGYDDKLWNDIKYTKIKERFVISYIGSISFKKNMEKSFRNLNNFFQACSELIKDGIDLYLNIVGADDIDINYINELNKLLNNKISFYGTVDVLSSYQYMVSSSVLLLLHTVTDDSSKYIISAKLYDYMRSRSRILSIGNNNSLHNIIINEYNLGIHCTNEVNAIKKSILILYEDWQKGIVNYIPNIEEFSRQSQNNKFLDLFI